MENFFCSRDFGIGVVSGIVSGIFLSGFVWLMTYLSKRKLIIIPSSIGINPDLVSITNIGMFKIEGIELSGQISFHDDVNLKTWYIKIDEEKTYISRKILNPKSDPRTYNIDVTDCIPNHNFNSLQEIVNRYPHSTLTIYISYHGRLSQVKKWGSREFKLGNNGL